MQSGQSSPSRTGRGCFVGTCGSVARARRSGVRGRWHLVAGACLSWCPGPEAPWNPWAVERGSSSPPGQGRTPVTGCSDRPRAVPGTAAQGSGLSEWRPPNCPSCCPCVPWGQLSHTEVRAWLCLTALGGGAWIHTGHSRDSHSTNVHGAGLCWDWVQVGLPLRRDFTPRATAPTHKEASWGLAIRASARAARRLLGREAGRAQRGQIPGLGSSFS